MSRAREAVRRLGLSGRRRKGPVRDRGLPPSPNGASSFHIWWSLPDTGLASVSAVLEVLSPPAAERLAFFALQASFWSPAGCEGGAHAGLQWNPRHPGSRAVNWGGYDREGSILAGAPSPLPSAPDDPNTRDFAWTPGKRYRLTIGPGRPGEETGAGGGPARWPARIEGLDTGEDLVIRELLCPGDHLRSPVVWAELFGRCDDPSVAVRWAQPEAVTLEGAVLRVEEGRVTYQSHRDGGCSNTTVEADRAGVVQRSGCGRRLAHGAAVSWKAETPAA